MMFTGWIRSSFVNYERRCKQYPSIGKIFQLKVGIAVLYMYANNNADTVGSRKLWTQMKQRTYLSGKYSNFLLHN